VFDGEQTSFSRLQQRLGVTSPSPALVEAFPVVYCVFDLLEAGGEDLTARPLVERRARLEQAIRPAEGLRISEAWRDGSERRFAEACRSGWEGLIAKRAVAPYARGRSKDWLKLKCVLRQEFVGRFPAGLIGRARSSWRRSGSPSGRRRDGSGSPVSSACARTNHRQTSSGSKPAERRKAWPKAGRCCERQIHRSRALPTHHQRPTSMRLRPSSVGKPDKDEPRIHYSSDQRDQRRDD
jgi:ATP dependent DNA ligase domain